MKRMPLFRTKDFIKYNGNIYQITNIVWIGKSDVFVYEVKCINSKFDDSVVSTIGMAAEDKMEWIDQIDCVEKCVVTKSAVEWLLENACDYVVHHWNETELDVISLVEDFKEYMGAVDRIDPELKKK